MAGLGVFAGVLGACFQPDANDQELCMTGLVGDESCPCTAAGMCGPGLVCISNVCVADLSMATSTGSSTGTSASDTAASTSTSASTSSTTGTTGPELTTTTTEESSTGVGEETAAGESGETGGTTPPNLGAFRPGSRLAARVIDGGPGMVAFQSFYDTEIEAPCSFQAEPDGEMYCSPAQGFSLAYFTDATCSGQRLATPLSECASFGAGDYLRLPIPRPSSDPCSGTDFLPLFRAVEAVQTPSELFEYWDGTCRPATVSAESTYYTITQASFTDFVRGHRREELVDATSGLSFVYIDGEDGSSLQSEMLFEGQPCWAHAVDGDLGCWPSSYTYDSLFASASCDDVPVVQEFAACSPEPEFVVQYVPGECSELDTRVFQAGERVTSAVYRDEGAGACVAADSTVEFRRVGEELDRSIFPALEWANRESGRLRFSQARADEVHTLHTVEWFDAELETRCHISRTADGSFRCVPIGGPSRMDYFTDDACTSPAYAGDGCGAPYGLTERYNWDPESRTCFSVDEVVALGPYEGPLYALNPDCIETAPMNFEGRTLFEVTEVVPFDELPLVEMRLDR